MASGCPATRIPRRCASAMPRTRQLQLDVFGEIMDVHHQARRGGLVDQRIRVGTHSSRSSIIWRKSGQSPTRASGKCADRRSISPIPRSMAWVAFDRAIKSAETFGLEGPLDEWRKLREEICDEVCERGFDKELGSFRAVLRLQAARRQLAAAALRRLPAGFRSARARHRSRRSNASCCATAS